MNSERYFRRPLGVLAVATGASILAACASIMPTNGPRNLCSLSDGILTLRGPTDQVMFDCLKASSAARIVRVRSPGGSVTTAMQIAERLHGMNAELVIDGYCESSCANYFLPVARRVVVEPGARIVLHGSSDEHMLEKSGQRGPFEQQRAFAERFHIPLGWLLYRTEAEFQAGSNGRHVSGAVDTPPGDDRVAYIVVEEQFLRSCYPHLDIEFRSETYTDRMRRDAPFRNRLARDGFYPSGSLECIKPGE